MEKNLLEQFKSAFDKASEIKPFTKGAISLRKNGETWNLLGRFTNPYRDVDFHSNPLNGGDIVTDESHKEFETWLDKHPHHALELWSYHQFGTARKSRASWWAYTGTAFYANWPLTEEEAKGISSWALNNDPGMSFGFYVFKSNWDEGLIEKYRAFEASILPLSRAANPWTTFIVTSKENNNMFSEEKRKGLVVIHGEAFVADLEKDDGRLKEALDMAGVERKEQSEEAVIVVKETGELEVKVAGYATEDQVVAALKRVESAFSETVTTLSTQVANLAEANLKLISEIAALKGEVQTITETQTETSKAQAAPLSVLASYMPKSILAAKTGSTGEAAPKSVAEVDGRSTLAKSMPAGARPKTLGLRVQDLGVQ